MNFLERRRFLKKANFLDLTPVRKLESEPREEGLVTLLMPRFKNVYLSRMFQPQRKEKFIRIKLDLQGSAVWLHIDGKSSVGSICQRVLEQNPSLYSPASETETRVTRFLSQLYLQRYITFREIEQGK
jgi:hypothetical protein